jgi:hypothetical protein
MGKLERSTGRYTTSERDAASSPTMIGSGSGTGVAGSLSSGDKVASTISSTSDEAGDGERSSRSMSSREDVNAAHGGCCIGGGGGGCGEPLARLRCRKGDDAERPGTPKAETMGSSAGNSGRCGCCCCWGGSGDDDRDMAARDSDK